MANIQPSQVNLELAGKNIHGRDPVSLHSLTERGCPQPWMSYSGCPQPCAHLCCQVPLQHGRDGPLQHLFATTLKWNGKQGITLGHKKRTPEEMIHPMAGLCLTTSPSQRWSGPGTAGCRAAWGEKGLGASGKGPHTSLHIPPAALCRGRCSQPPPHLQAMGATLTPQP